MAEGGAERRYWATCLLPILAFTTAATDGRAQVVVPLHVFLLSVLVFVLSRTSGSSAAWATVDSQELVAHFTFRSSERIPLARVAAVEVRRRLAWTRSIWPETIALISVYREDVPNVIELRARMPEADAFLFALAQNAKRLGRSTAAPFAIPRRHDVHQLLPLLPALAIPFLLPFRVSWGSLGLGLGVFLIHSLLARRRFAQLAKHIARAREGAPSRIQAWLDLLRSA
ncbi:MAG: hypothetical protein KF795_20945 [Labilithrix sp.]|nr:hypothetical protein [Labilithrix sp.]